MDSKEIDIIMKAVDSLGTEVKKINVNISDMRVEIVKFQENHEGRLKLLEHDVDKLRKDMHAAKGIIAVSGTRIEKLEAPRKFISSISGRLVATAIIAITGVLVGWVVDMAYHAPNPDQQKIIKVLEAKV